MVTLFSPVGTADPLTQLGDGPMLHIVRYYKPDRVVLFLSPEMTAYESQDHRYTDAIRLLCKLTGQAAPSVEMVKSSRSDVQHFDAFIGVFEDQLKRIRKQDKHVDILANVSSGTPAMEQALVALGAFGEYNMRLLQVPTPRGGRNGRDDRENPVEFDLETLWELNPDNYENAGVNRVEEVSLPNFKDRIIRQNVKALLDGYDYDAALILARQSPQIPDQVLSQVKAASDRLNLAMPSSGRQPTAYQKLSEYLSVQEVRMKQGRWADFVRAMTPAYTHTAILQLQKHGLPPSKYLLSKSNDDDGYTDRLSFAAIEGDEKLSTTLSDVLEKQSRFVHIENWMLEKLINVYCPEEISFKFQLVRALEEGSRNDLAHKIVRANKDEIERAGWEKACEKARKSGLGSDYLTSEFGRRGWDAGKITFEEVMNALLELAGVNSGKYDDINRQIFGLLRR